MTNMNQIINLYGCKIYFVYINSSLPDGTTMYNMYSVSGYIGNEGVNGLVIKILVKAKIIINGIICIIYL